jgi:hypothetical protein
MSKKLFILITMCLVSTGLYAQVNNQFNISVRASINSTLETITIQTIDFQDVERDNSIINIDPVLSPRAGKIIIRGSANSEFRLDYIRERDLSNIDGTGTISFIYFIAGNRIDEQDTAELLDQDVRDLTFNEDGEFYIWVGGNVDLSNVEPGSYEGDFTVEVEYI